MCGMRSFFCSIATQWGRFVSLDPNTKDRKRFDMARILLSTSYLGFIASAMPVHVNGQLFVIRVSEEIAVGIWTAPSTCVNSNRKKVHRDAMVVGESRPQSPSISVVPCTPKGMIGVSPASIAPVNCVGIPKSHDASRTSLESDDQ
ncbi:hypothetical protein Ancab_004820 [Ancistrocladus abbreviatus]